MQRLVISSLTAAVVAGCLLAGTSTATAAAPCGEGYYLPASSLLCVPDPTAIVAQTIPAPDAPAAPAPAPHRSILDRLLGRNRPVPAAPAPAAPPAPPAPPPVAPAPPAPGPNQAGGNSASGGDAGVLGPLGPVISPGTGSGPDSGANGIGLVPGGSHCSPGAVIAVLGDVYTCPVVASAPLQTQTAVIPGQPPAAGQSIVEYHLPVTG
jgi:pyruvate dehydrogenase E2 component (dihydrolipoyllysine-residue acetyltransferase)